MKTAYEEETDQDVPQRRVLLFKLLFFNYNKKMHSTFILKIYSNLFFYSQIKKLFIKIKL